MSAVAIACYIACLVCLSLCSYFVDETRRARKLAEVYRDSAERFYKLSIEQCERHTEHLREHDTRMFSRLQATFDTGRVPPERKPD